MFVSYGETPTLTHPQMDRWAMVAGLIRHARIHYAYFQEHTDGLLTRRDPENPKGVHLVIKKAKAVSPGDELLLELEVKHVVEDLRAALEYVALEIFERVCCREATPQPHDHRNTYFPIPHEEDDAETYGSVLDGVFPGLRTTNSDVFELLRACRAHVGGQDVWLDTLHSAWNEFKHRRLASSTKPMRVHVAGFDTEKLPPVVVLYFPDTIRAVAPNLSAAIDGIEKLAHEAKRLLAR